MIRLIVANCNIRHKVACKNILNPYNRIKSRCDKPCGVVVDLKCWDKKERVWSVPAKNYAWEENFTKGDIKLLRSRDMGRAVAVRRWTPTAIDCYKRGCNCEGCFYKDFFSGSTQKCQMKASVLELVRVIGTPNIELQQILSEEF